MKRNSPNPKAIGAFVTAMLALIVGLVLYFGTANFLNRSTDFILFFDQSVNGLQIGSPVKFRGVPVGEVKRIMIRAEGQREDSTAIPVIIQLNRSRLEGDLGVSNEAFDPESIEDSLDLGLIAELNLESFITGQLFVELNFDQGRAAASKQHLETVNGIYEIPTLSSSLDQITADAAQIISDFKELDLNELNDNINGLLVSAKSVLDGIDSEGISRSINEATGEITAFVGSEGFKETVLAMRDAFQEIRGTAESFNLEEGPLAQAVDTWTAQITKTLSSLETLAVDASLLLKPGSDVRHQFETMLRELSRTARSVRLLSEYLERNPNALLTGRSEDE